ncbi:hypothetical protein Rxyl_1816 [Rubrobacter xylanophilus DSM 9941]|uniref:Uncharacterized protein n=1 Tax=Rubrobacter xylanophilus (strain DSM 9941 / JCM 11954 / NBRC 16129 / PRD-1) TaxID=266117 RepID=Q1AV03_RUBXD|nr:hypothetical protein [Rubrobacter xylanophilus]ABG04775.1 hypothetical protein Rxyl_1816 [Rubrobacter xylanophilus DSM 9941]
MAAGSMEERDGDLVSAVRRAPVHHVVARRDGAGLELLRVPLVGRGEALPVFSAGWAARGYLFAEAPGGGWHVRACSPEEMISLLSGSGAGVGWVALDPVPGRGGTGAPNVMPRENFLDYLRCLGAPALPLVEPLSGHRRDAAR